MDALAQRQGCITCCIIHTYIDMAATVGPVVLWRCVVKTVVVAMLRTFEDTVPNWKVFTIEVCMVTQPCPSLGVDTFSPPFCHLSSPTSSGDEVLVLSESVLMFTFNDRSRIVTVLASDEFALSREEANLKKHVNM